MTQITVHYSSIDGFRKTRSFKTLEGARKFAVHYVGEDADRGSSYAVSFDGVGKVTVDGCTLDELFSGRLAGSRPYEVWYCAVNEGSSYHPDIKYLSCATLAEANHHAEELEEYADGVRIVGTTEEAKAAITAQHDRWQEDLLRDNDFPF